MSILKIEIPVALAEKARDMASRQGMTLEGHVAASLEQQVAANDLHERVWAAQGKVSRRRFAALLAKAPDSPPASGDELPAKRRQRRVRHSPG
jgi:hypothetical protein